MALTWNDVEPRVRELLDADLTPADVPAWLERRDALEREVGEAYATLARAKDEDTANEAARDAYLRFVREVSPHVSEASDALDKKLLGVAGYEPPAALRVWWRNVRDDVAVFHPANVPLATRESELAQRFDELMGAVRAEVDGESLTLTQARRILESTERERRERAWRAIQAGLERVRPDLDTLFLELVRLRHTIARNAGFDDYRAYVWRARHRHEYTPDDALALHDSMRAAAVPALRAIHDDRRERLGAAALRPWDLDVDPDGAQPLAPFSDVAELEAGLVRMFEALDPALARRFERLRDGWLDLEPRPNKVPGLGYQSYFPRSRSPYVYWSALGTDDDVVTMRHEAGHAFHSQLTDERWPLLAHMANRPEAWELASQSLELLTLPYLERERGGFYDARDARRSTRVLLERMIGLWVRTSAVDAIQHWIYTQDPDTLTAEAIDEAWVRISRELGGDIDWTGLERDRAKGWQIIHVFVIPFYFLEYGIAYLGAAQVWRNALRDHAEALAAYQRFLSLGGTVPLDEAYEAAGARFAFDEATVRELVEFTLARWREAAPA
jgi:oligoendopeptidase F